MPISLRLDPDIEARLAYLAQATGRSKTFYLRKLIEEHLEELEDAYLAEHALEQLRQGRDHVMTPEEFWRDLEG
jgi:RHH-type transcriptional regulator, rel operon repressor / antitoxin RelB